MRPSTRSSFRLLRTAFKALPLIREVFHLTDRDAGGSGRDAFSSLRAKIAASLIIRPYAKGQKHLTYPLTHTISAIHFYYRR